MNSEEGGMFDGNGPPLRQMDDVGPQCPVAVERPSICPSLLLSNRHHFSISEWWRVAVDRERSSVTSGDLGLRAIDMRALLKPPSRSDHPLSLS